MTIRIDLPMYGRPAITTKYHGATNTKGARISAHYDGKTVMVNWQYGAAENISEERRNHAEAAKRLAEKLGWQTGRLVGGCLNDSSYVFICVD